MDHSSHNKHFKVSIMATTHCLIGCSIGEVGGMVLTTAFNLSNFLSILISILLAFFFGYLLTLIPLIQHKLSLKKAFGIAIASDTLSISTMEFMDNLIIILIPQALNAKLKDPLFWESLIASLIVAFIVAVPVNYFLIKKGKGHALAHGSH